jgi:autotransporter-associated beta strand protein
VEVSDADTNLTLSGASTNTTGGLIKIGAGKLTLGGANLYTGLTDVQAGTLAYGANNTTSSGAVQVSGGTLDISSYSDTVGAVTLTGGSITGSTGVLTGTSYGVLSGSISAILAGAVALNKTTSGTVILSGANTYTGVNTVSAGTLRATTSASALGTGSASLTLSGGTLELANDTGLDFARNTTLSANSTINSDVLTSGATGVTHSLGALTLTGQTLTIGGGVNVGSGTAGITFGAVAVNGGAVTTTFNVNSGELLTLGTVTPAGGGSKVIAFGGNGDTTVSGVLNDASGASTASVTKSGNGTLILANANLYEAATTISGGVVRAQNNTALGTTAAGVSVSDGAALELDGAAGALTIGAEALTLNGNGISSGGALRNVAGNNSYAGIITLASASRINSDAGVLTINSAGSITGNFGLTFGGAGDIVLSDAFAPVTTTQTLTKDGAGKLTLNRANTYTGLTTVSAGTLEYGVANTLSSGGVMVSGGTWDLRTFSDTVGAVTLTSGTISSSSGVLTGTSYAVQSGSVGAILAGNGTLTKTTTGTVILSGANTYTGLTYLQAGTLNVQNAAGLGGTSNGVSVGAGAALELQGGITVGAEALSLSGTGVSTNGSLRNVSGNNTYRGLVTLGLDSRINSDAGRLTLDVASGNAITGTYNLTFGGAGNITVADAIATSTGTLTKDGAGTLTLSGANTFTGLTTISGGTLALGANNTLSSAVTVSGGILDTATFSDSVGAVTLTSGSITGNGTLTGTSYALQSGNVSANLGTGNMTVTAGNTTLSGTSASTAVAIHSGKLTLGSSDRLADAAAVTINGGILDMAGFGDTVASVVLTSGSITDGTLTSSAAYDAQSGSVSSILAGSVGLNKTSSGTVTLTGANTYTGKTTISGGTLAIGTNGSIANTSEVSLGGGNFNVSAVTSYALGLNQSLTGSGLVSGDLTINGTLAIGASPGTINFANDLTLGLGSVSNFEFTSGSFGALSFDLAQGGLAHTVNFGGTLNLFFKSDETFTSGTSVKIFDFGYYASNFSAVNVSGMGVGTNATFDSSTGIVTVIPEPRAALLGGLGLLVLLCRRRA